MRCLKFAAAFGLLIVFTITCPLVGQDRIRAGQAIQLQQQLETGLRARLPAEFDYLEDIASRVESGQIPQSLVRRTFAYARKKGPYPIQYFDRALRILGGRQGIVGIPPLKVTQQR